MRLLLDTHVILWWLQDSRKLSSHCRDRIIAATEVYISSASIWETAIKVGAGKLRANLDELIHQIAQDGFLELGVSIQHAISVSALPQIHHDPFDRMLVAQAISESMCLLTADRVLAAYSGLVELI